MKRSVGLGATTLLFALISLAGCSGGSSTHELREGPWRAWLMSPGGELPFGLELTRNADGWQAVIANGTERIHVPRVEVREDRLVLSIDHYDSEIGARIVSDGELEGRWVKTAAEGAQSTLKFRAVAGALERFPALPGDDAAGAFPPVDGRWDVRFESDMQRAVGIFESREGGRVEGTFLTATGDYRFLEGSYRRGRLLLSCFDGAHAFLFDARLQADGSLSGEFWSRDSWHETWTARRDPDAALPDGFGLTRWTGNAELSDLVFRDLEGNDRSPGEAGFSGRPMLLEIFGTWCPNCNDAAQHLVELDRRYRDRGLQILGLAFELTGNFARDARQVERYAEHHGIEFPLWIAGRSDKEAASLALPVVDRVRAFPTTLFVGADGNVRAVHTGFSGPATGEAHDRMRAEFERTIEAMLGDDAGGQP